MDADEAVAPWAGFLSQPAKAAIQDLEFFFALLQKWQRAKNLVSRETLSEFWQRHIADSLQVLPLLGDAKSILDLGSGGGFPALPLAIAKKGDEVRFTLIESNSRKCSFLRTVVRELQLKATVVDQRVDAINPGSVPAPDVITSRAFAPLPELLALVYPFWQPHTRALLHKGGEHESELADCSPKWSFDVLQHPSTTDAKGVILEISELRRNFN